MSPRDIEVGLKRHDPVLFAKISEQVIGRWIDRTGPKPVWKASVLARVQAGHHIEVNIPRKSILSPYPAVTEQLVDQLLKLRLAGIPLNTARCRGIIIAHLHHYIPQIFTTPSKDGSFFHATDAWVKKFVHETLDWSFCRSTRAAQKLPNDADMKCEEQFLCHALTCRDTAIDIPGLRVNIDQTNKIYQINDSSTYEKVGARQVAVVGKEEKRAFTIVVGVSDAGDLLPFQVIYGGKSKRSLPTTFAPRYQDALELGICFEFSNTDTYWSTFELMCKYVKEILVPYWMKIKADAGIPPDQECILQLDVWSVHRSIAFRTWLDVHYFWIVYLFVPANCTSVAQPCDVGIQRLLKLSMKKCQHAEIVDETLALLRDGQSATELRLTTAIGPLRDRSVNWLVTAFHAINKPEIVKKAFTMCKAGQDFNLSFESVTSREALRLLNDVQKNRPALWATISAPRERLTEDKDVEMAGEDHEDGGGSDDEFGDEAAVPLDVILQDISAAALPIGYSKDANGTVFLSNISEEYEQAADEDPHDPSAEQDLSRESAPVAAYGRGKRKGVPNRKYAEFWRH